VPQYGGFGSLPVFPPFFVLFVCFVVLTSLWPYPATFIHQRR